MFLIVAVFGLLMLGAVGFLAVQITGLTRDASRLDHQVRSLSASLANEPDMDRLSAALEHLRSV